ncbi:MAG TPA: ABC transporter ATP-binding protein [Burkholderiales bacterium]|nr:ABC transporter ATP-binding protein [Burkholderiales bacterium]
MPDDIPTVDVAAIRFENVTKSYGARPALQALDLVVPRGVMFGLVGANGAGKTTLIKCLLDFCGFEAGDIRIFGTPSETTAARARLAFLPERFVPPYYLTGQDFLRFALRMYKLDYLRTQAETMLEALDLEGEALTKPVHAFSKGMTQKLGLAACLLSARELLVLDEPTSGLDPKARVLLKQQLRSARDRGTTVFFTSHALADVEELCDEMAVLHQGRLRYRGTPAGLKQRYERDALEQAYLACIA